MKEERIISKLRAAYREHNTKGYNTSDFVHAFGSGREALMYAQLFWPEFVEYNGMVFLKSAVENDDDKRRLEEALKRYGRDLVKTEQSFNLVEVPYLFGRRMGETDEEEYGWLAEILCEIWRCRLRTLFPGRSFKVEVLELGQGDREPALIFYQSPSAD